MVGQTEKMKAERRVQRQGNTGALVSYGDRDGSPQCRSFSYKNTTNEQFVETNSEVSFFPSVAKSIVNIDCSQTVDKHVNQFKGEEDGKQT